MPVIGSEVDAARRALEEVLKSPGFVRNQRLACFLRFLIDRHLEGRDQELKESVIGVEVFGRTPGYNPKEDPVVRTEARRLRERLAAYYESTGTAHPAIVELPKGGYVPLVRIVSPSPEPIASFPFRLRKWRLAAFAFMALVIRIRGCWLDEARPTQSIALQDRYRGLRSLPSRTRV